MFLKRIQKKMTSPTIKDANKVADEICLKYLDKPEEKFVKLSVEGLKLLLTHAYMKGKNS
jgi:hypothetical protein